MQVMVFLSEAKGGGAQRRLGSIARGLAAAGHRVVWVSAASLPSGFALEGCEVLGLDVPAAGLPVLRNRRLLWVPAAAPRLARLLRERAPDVLLTTSTPAILAAAAARARGSPATALVASVNLLPTQHLGPGPLAGAVAAAWGRVLRRADAVVAISQGLAGAVRVLVGRDGPPVTCVPNPLDLAAVERLAREPPAFVPPGEGPLLVACGKLRPQKDHTTLIRAFAHIRHRLPARLVILGEGPLRPRLEALARDLGVAADVHLPGWVENPFAILARADVFVHSSRFEGLGNALLEALACGCRIVATDCPFGPREVLDGGRFGILVPPGDPQALARGVEEALARPHRPQVQRERAAAFAPDRALAGYLAAMRTAIATTRRGRGRRGARG